MSLYGYGAIEILIIIIIIIIVVVVVVLGTLTACSVISSVIIHIR